MNKREVISKLMDKINLIDELLSPIGFLLTSPLTFLKNEKENYLILTYLGPKIDKKFLEIYLKDNEDLIKEVGNYIEHEFNGYQYLLFSNHSSLNLFFKFKPKEIFYSG